MQKLLSMIYLKSLRRGVEIDKVIVHSLDWSLYQASIVIDGQEQVLAGKDGRPVRARSMLQLEAMFEDFKVKEMVLRQESAYDEMINQPVRECSNRIEVPVGRNNLGYGVFK